MKRSNDLLKTILKRKREKEKELENTNNKNEI